MHRRTLLRTAAGLAAAASIAAKPALARGRGRGQANRAGGLVNAEVTPSGAVVATGDDFVIADQTIAIDDRSFVAGDDGHVAAIRTEGYDGTVRDNELVVDELAHAELSAIRVTGGRVTVRDNTIVGDDRLARQFLGISAVEGASARIEANSVEGGHRVGILATGDGTDARIEDNRVVGLGRKDDAWAENGIQVSGGATGAVVDNTVADHWYGGDAMSSGIILFEPGDGVRVHRNRVADSDAGIVAWGGDDTHLLRNEVAFTEDGPGPTETYTEGIWVSDATNTRVINNDLSAVGGDVGIYLVGASVDTKLIRNAIEGFDEPLIDAAIETILPAPFDPRE